MSGHWFRAKRYGWGWTPVTWQGWMVMAAFVGLMVAAALILPPRRSLGAYLALMIPLVVALIGVCWWKGERPRWRWGSGGDR